MCRGGVGADVQRCRGGEVKMCRLQKCIKVRGAEVQI
jgi:hypothetical protein